MPECICEGLRIPYKLAEVWRLPLDVGGTTPWAEVQDKEEGEWTQVFITAPCLWTLCDHTFPAPAAAPSLTRGPWTIYPKINKWTETVVHQKSPPFSLYVASARYLLVVRKETSIWNFLHESTFHDSHTLFLFYSLKEEGAQNTIQSLLYDTPLH